MADAELHILIDAVAVEMIIGRASRIARARQDPALLVRMQMMMDAGGGIELFWKDKECFALPSDALRDLIDSYEITDGPG